MGGNNVGEIEMRNAPRLSNVDKGRQLKSLLPAKEAQLLVLAM